MTVRTVSVELIAKISNYATNMTKAVTYAKTLSTELDTLGRKAPDRFNKVAMAAGGAGLSLLGVSGAVVKLESDFDKAMSAVSAATHAGTGEMKALRQAAIEAGQTTQFSATQAAQGITELAKAGVSTAAILKGGLKGALDLAAAGQLEVGDAAEVAATAMTQFRLKGDQIPHLADLLAAGAGKAQGSVHDMSLALKQSGLVASEFGLSVDETVGTLTAFASAGLIGSDAGTSFKQMLLQLAAPSQKAAALMDQLGIKAYDAQGKFVGIAGLADQLHKNLSGLTQAERDYALATIFGTDAIRSANVLYQQGATGIQQWTNKVNDAGYASDTASRLTDNLSGDVMRLNHSLDTLAIQSGTGANDGLRSLTKSANALVHEVSALPGWMQQTAVVGSALTGVLILGAAGAAKARQKMGELTQALTNMGPAGGKAARGLETAAKGATLLAAAFAAAEIAGTLGRQFQEALPPTSKLVVGLRDLAAQGRATGDAAKQFGADLGGLKEDLNTVGSASGFRKTLVEYNDFLGVLAEGARPEKLGAATGRVKALDDALAELVTRGQAAQAARVVQQLGLNADQVAKLLPSYNSALGDLKENAAEAAQAQGDAAVAAVKVKTSFTDAYQAVGGLSDAFDALNKTALDADDAVAKLEGAYDSATKSIKDNGRTLDIHTDKGRANRSALKDIARAADDAMQKMADNGATVDVVRAKYEEARKTFIKDAIAMGATRAEATKLADQWLKMPDKVTTTVTAPGLDPLQSRLAKVNDQLDHMDGRQVNVKVITDFYDHLHGEIKANRWGGVYQHAATGVLRDAQIYSAAAPARYAYAEPSTGGEAFIPKRGNYGRSMAIVSEAARWYGASVVPGGTQQASASPMVSPEAVGRAVRTALQGMTVVMDGRVVGQLTARTADRYQRGG